LLKGVWGARTELLEVVRELLDTPIPVNPTPAHLSAAQSFSTILTTNYDLLFERACAALGKKFAVATPHRPLPDPAPITIYKIDGSIDDPDTLVFTHADAAKAATATPFWNSVNSLMQTHGVIVIGHSIRDITSQRLLSTRILSFLDCTSAPIISTNSILSDWRLTAWKPWLRLRMTL
jgi:hypothetical protein